MTDNVLVTGGFGLVGSQVVRRLIADGRRVVVTDLGTPQQRKAAASLPAGAEVRWVDLTNPQEVDQLVAGVSPTGLPQTPSRISRYAGSLRRPVGCDSSAAR